MEKGLFKKLALLITYVVVLVAVIVKIDAVGAWVSNVLSAFSPLFIGFAIAFILNRPCNFFARVYQKHFHPKTKKAARPLAVVTAYVIFLAIITVIIWLIVPELVRSIETFISNLSGYAANLESLYNSVVNTLGLETLAGLNLPAIFNENLSKLLSGALDVLTNTLPHLITVTGVVVNGVITAVLSLVFSAYMLSGGPRLLNQCRRLTVHYLPKKMVEPTLSVVKLTADTFTRYISGQVIEAFILGALCFLGMCVFSFDYAALISTIITVSALVPVVGAFFGAIASAVLLLMIDPMQALWFLVFLLILQQLEGNLIYPRVVGSSIGLPGIWVLAAVTVGSSLMGFVGLVAGVPITAVVYTLLKKNLHKREGITDPPEETKTDESSETTED